MNILMMTNTYRPHVGGVARSVDSSARWLRSQGHRVLTVAPSFESQGDTERDVFRVPAVQHFNGSDFSLPLPLTRPLHTAVEGFRPDIVHSHHPFLLGDTALRVSAEFDVPIVFTHHTMYERYTGYVPLSSPRMMRFAIQLATGYANLCDAVFAPSESIASILRERGVRRQIEVVPTGVDIEHFASGDGAMFRRSHGIPGAATVVGHVGRLAPEKNLRFLGGVLAELAALNQTIHVLIVGDGPEAPGIRARFKQHGVIDRLHETGTIQGEVLSAAYRAMDLFAFASTSETQGLVLAEAMAAGVPVVAIDGPGVREVVRDSENGRLVPSAHPDQLLAALVSFARPETRRELERGIAETARAFSIDAIGRRVISIYQDLEMHTMRDRPGSDGAWGEARRRIREEWNLVTHRAQVVRHSFAP